MRQFAGLVGCSTNRVCQLEKDKHKHFMITEEKWSRIMDKLESEESEKK